MATPGRLASVYSELQASRLDVALPLPSVLKSSIDVLDGPPSSASGNPDEIAKLFPNVFGQPSASIVPSSSAKSGWDSSLKIGVVLSGGQAPGGHNVISGIFDYLQARAKGSTMYGFKGGPAGIMNCKYVELSTDFIYPYRNQGGFDMICSGRDKIETPEQFKQAQETAKKLDLDGIVVIGGDDSNTNACLLAENFRGSNLKTRVIGCPKTIDGDLKCKEVPTSFGFDTACKIFAEMIGNVMIDARSTGKYYHLQRYGKNNLPGFISWNMVVRLMGRAASHITLECALQTHPNITIIGEEVAAQKQTLKNVTDYITDIICKRAELGYNYGVILIPEGLIDFIPEVQQLIAELNEILAHDTVDEAGTWKKKLRSQSQQLFDFLPEAIQEQLLLERDPHGNVQVARIETEKMLIQMVETELESRKIAGAYKHHFQGQSHFFGYEGRCGLPSNFDSNYCYSLGYAAGALLHSGKTGLISSVGNLNAPVEEWTVGGTALTSLMDVERRHGKFKPVIKKAMVELEAFCRATVVVSGLCNTTNSAVLSIFHINLYGRLKRKWIFCCVCVILGAPFKKFASVRDEWAIKNRYVSPVVRLMGRAASQITFECALQTHPNITIIGEEVAAQKQTLKNVTDYITDIICKRAELGYNYGVILIPEGLIDFIPEVQQLIAELNEILAHDTVDEAGTWKKKLRSQSQQLFDFLPQAIQEQLLLERDPHGNVQVARIETEKMLIQMVETELESRKIAGAYKHHFQGQSHFFGYEGRCGLPSNFDSNYCYSLGYAAGALLHSGKTGLISSVGNLNAPVEEWTVGGTALTSLMDVERRHGKFKPVIKKAMVELEGPLQFSGPTANDINHTLMLELEAQA
ncbi:unnamed protein product [Camellia sinensis]